MPARRAGTPLVYLALTAGTVVVALPFFWMFISALKPPAEIFDLRLLPAHPTFDNFREVLTRTQFPRWFGNSLLVALATTASVAFFDSLVGYTLAKLQFPGRNVIFVTILATLMIPTEMLIIPWYILSSARGWINTYWGIMFPGMITAFGIFLMRQFMTGVPDELLDAGRIDGVSEFGLYWRIALPQVRPAMAALCIFTFLGNWNAFLWPMIVIQTPGRDRPLLGRSGFGVEPGDGRLGARGGAGADRLRGAAATNHRRHRPHRTAELTRPYRACGGWSGGERR
jgi:multiple sugar transport system permease protein